MCTALPRIRKESMKYSWRVPRIRNQAEIFTKMAKIGFSRNSSIESLEMDHQSQESYSKILWDPEISPRIPKKNGPRIG